jgi:hypothetical protein
VCPSWSISPPKIDLLSGKFFKKLVGKKDVEDSVQRLDKLTQEVARLAETEVQVLTVTRLNDAMKVVDNRVEDFNSGVHEIGHSSQQGGTKLEHESPRGGEPTRDTDQSTTQALTFLSSSSSGLYSDFGPRGAG